MAQAEAARPDLVILDLGLPDMDGLEVIRRIRGAGLNLPILVLSARSESAEKVAALDLGANDYVTKPFDMNELLARVRAATRTVAPGDVPHQVRLGEVTVDLVARVVHGRGNTDTADGTDGGGSDSGDTIRLTPTEWTMLDTLLRRPGMLTTQAELLTAMRGEPEHTERSYLRIYMQQLRRKLEPDPSRPRHLVTEPGLGYRYVP